MRLYHYFLALMILVLSLITSACGSPQITPPVESIDVQIYADGKEYKINIPAGSTVQNVLDAAGVNLEGKDRVEPRASTTLQTGMIIQVIRVEEIFETEQEIIPFRVIRLPNESLPEGKEQWLQEGKNGLKEITYLKTLENGVEVSYDIVGSAIIQERVDEIGLIGSQNYLSPINLPGRLVYLSYGKAWMMEGTTANRSLIVATGDLDGRVFTLSDDGEWLLFTRQSDSEDVINTLWAAQIDGDEERMIDFGIENVIHFGAWLPGSNREAAFSTVETRSSPPGWQANNDLRTREFDLNGWTHRVSYPLDTNYGGVYGWWGTDFAYAPGGEFLAYVGPDQLGIVDLEAEEKQPLLEITPYQTRGDWAWMPGIAISPNGDVIYTVDHAPPEVEGDAEKSPIFDLVVIPVGGGAPIRLVPEVGMFAYPKTSQVQTLASGERAHQIAYLQANFPKQSEKLSYRVAVIDRDGSNQRIIFPPLEQPALEPQRHWGVWSPAGVDSTSGQFLALIYQDDIWIVNTVTEEAWQITGSGEVLRVDWK
ncbi:MAG: hypothetical protein B6I38_06400 [Anaerolineaceae bacterium 4572_5.1]|nr:MAG: hypothetical protein B6I38_06400 [Anaerolineaceae bacterium 4572_5.1]